MNTATGKRFQILSLSGGGYRGLHIAHVLEIIEQQIGGRIGKHFDLIAGTSIGGIIALAIASEIPATNIRQTLEELGPRLFHRLPPDFPLFRELFSKSGFKKGLYGLSNWAALQAEGQDAYSAWYDPIHLKNELKREEYFCERKIKDLNHPVMIPAVNYSAGVPKFFKTDHHRLLSFDAELSLIDVALGTAAAPVFFPIHKIRDWRIADGGLIANDPTQVAVHEAMQYFGIRPSLFGDTSTGSDDLRVLSIGTLSPKHFADVKKPLDQGMLDWGTGVFDLAMSEQEASPKMIMEQRVSTVCGLISWVRSLLCGMNPILTKIGCPAEMMVMEP